MCNSPQSMVNKKRSFEDILRRMEQDWENVKEQISLLALSQDGKSDFAILNNTA